MEHEIDYRVTV